MNTRTRRPPERSRRPRGAPPYQNRPVPPPPDGGLSLSPDPASSAASAPHGSGSWGKMRRGTRTARFHRIMAIALAGFALMAGGREAGAQALTELVSNRMTGSGAGRQVCAACSGESRRGQNDGSSSAYAQALTTGPGGATLLSIDVRLRLRTDEPQTPTLEIRRGTPNGPLVATLNGPTITVTRQTRVRSFVAPAGTVLAAMTTYFVVVKNAEIIISSTGSTWQRAASTGWTLERGLWISTGERGYGVSFENRPSRLRMRVWGSQTEEQRAAGRVPERPEARWTCDSNGDGTVDGRDRETIAIVGGGTTFASAAQRIEEGQEEGRNIAIQITKASPATGDCWAEPDAPWVATLRLTRRATGVLTPRVSESQLADRRIEIHRNQQTVTVTIDVEDNDIAQGETIIEAELVRHADTHEQLMIQNAKKRFTIYDEDGWELFLDLPCGDIRVTEGVDKSVRLPLGARPAPEFPWRFSLVALAGSAVPGRDYVYTNAQSLIEWKAGQEATETQIRLIDDKVLEDEKLFSLRMFRNGLRDSTQVSNCPGVEGQSRTVIIEDDDRAVIQMGPQRRSVAPGETIRFVASYDLEGSCPVPFSKFVRQTISAGASELNEPSPEPTRYSHCASELVLEYETKAPQCRDYPTTEIRFRFTIDNPDERLTIEHDEYVVRIERTEADYAKMFTTGSAANGYVFDTLAVGVSSGTCMPVNGKVEIWAASTQDQRPTMLVRQLSWKSRSDVTFTSDPGKKLEPNTRYHVVMLTEGATRFSNTGNGRTTLSDGANPAGVTVNSMTRFKRNIQSGSAWQPDEDDEPLRIALTLTAVAAPPVLAAEPADDTVDWKTSITVGNWTSITGEYERGWRVQDCVQTRLDTSDIEDHHPNDFCYGSIGEKQFIVGNTTYTLRGVYHGVSTYDDSVTMEFEGETDLTALADRAFIINGKTFWMSGASIPGGIANAQAIVWPEPEWTSAGGWPLGSTVWVGLQARGTSSSHSTPRTTVTRDGSGPVHGPFGIAVTFSEDVTGFDASDIDVVNGELVRGSLTPNDERTWNARVAPARSGTVTVSVPEGAAEAEGTDNAPAEPLVVEADVAPALATVRRIGDGPFEGPFSVRVTFSKPVTGLTMDELDIEGGWATGMASESDGQSHEVLITPNEGAQTITITVPADVAQDANGRGNAGSATLRIDAPAPPLEASFVNVPSEHDGKKAFTVKLSFSAEPRGLSYKTVRDSLLEVSCATESCGTVTKALRVTDGSDREWNVTVEPSQAYAITLTLPPRACSETAAVCVGGRPLAEPASATIPGTPLTATLTGPAEHDGSESFEVRLTFSMEPDVSYKTVRDTMFTENGGAISGARRVKPPHDREFDIVVKPGGDEAVSFSLASPLPACGETGSVCTAAGRKIEGTVAATILGPAALSVADARVREGPGSVLAFAVTLDRARSEPVTVDYATSEGTGAGAATEDSDYTATSGRLTFAAGETKQTVSVPVLDDAHDEDEETMTLTLSTPVGARLADGTATGTIVNSDPIPQAWLARFGRTVATHVTDAVGERLRGAAGQDSHVTVGGYRLPLGRPPPEAAEPGTDPLASVVTGLATGLGLNLPGAGGAGPEPDGGEFGGSGAGGPDTDPRLGRSQTLRLQLPRLRDVLLGSSFRLTLGRDDAGTRPRLTAWGRVAATQFDGRDGALTLDGDVLTGTVGVDGVWNRWLAGVAVAHSRGNGSYTMPDAGAGGELDNTLTSLHPYLRYAVNERLDVWGVLGYGWGDLTVTHGPGVTLDTDTTLVMGTVGGRGILLPASETGGFQLATRTDAMFTRTTSEAVVGMAAADAEAHRLRVVLEGSRALTWADGRSLTPSVEVGLRHDWGDAETGFGVELGGRVQYADPSLGLTLDAAVRGLLAHEDNDYDEWGASGSLRLAPGAAGQGLSLTLAPTWGAASSGVNGLWTRQTTAGLAPPGRTRAPAGRLNAEVGYGVPAPFGTGLLTPYAGTVFTDGAGRTYRLGTRWTAVSGLSLTLEGRRQESPGQQPVNQGLQLQIGWGF